MSAAGSDLAGRPCPACAAATLERVEDKGVPFIGCTSCFGLFAAEPDLRRYVETAVGKPAAGEAFEALRQRACAGRVGRSVRRCPVCDVGLGRVSFGESPVVALDRCAVHGVWLDRTELKKVVRAARAHGAAAGLLPPFKDEPDPDEGQGPT